MALVEEDEGALLSLSRTAQQKLVARLVQQATPLSSLLPAQGRKDTDAEKLLRLVVAGSPPYRRSFSPMVPTAESIPGSLRVSGLGKSYGARPAREGDFKDYVVNPK
jgi:hypothetical protein